MRNEAASTLPGLRDPSLLVGLLTTKGRRTGLPRRVEINMIFLNGNFYATSASIRNKHWCQNMIQNPEVEVQVRRQRFRCRSRLVKEEDLRVRVLQLRDSPPLLGRAVFEMSPLDN